MYLTIETKRLSIRPIKLTDADFIFQLVNADGWLKFIGDRKIAHKTDAERYIQGILDKRDHYYSVFEIKESRKPIGIITLLKRENELSPDIGFALLPEFEKRGYALEATEKYLHEINTSHTYENIMAITLPDNTRSINLLKKLGLKHEYDCKKDTDTLSYYSLKRLKKGTG